VAANASQISAVVSAETKERLERYAQTFGVKKSHCIETALLHHLNALEQLPSDVVIPPIMVVARQSGSQLLERIANPRPPTAAMKALVDDGDSTATPGG
jgi:hypothetical protein